MERLLIDMDEVMADPLTDMTEWYMREFGGVIDVEKMQVGSWLKGFPKEHHVHVRERLRSKGFFRNLPVMKDCKEVLEHLNSKYDIYIVSAATEFPNSLTDKMEWLEEHFPYLSWRKFVFCGDKRLMQGEHMIDDHPRNMAFFNGKKYLFDAPHNVHVEGFVRVKDWKEIEYLLG